MTGKLISLNLACFPLSYISSSSFPGSVLIPTYPKSLAEESDKEVEPYRKAFEAAVGTYMAEHYLNGTAMVYGSRNNQKAELIVCISSSKFSPSNYWNGRWRAKWQCDFVIGSTKVDLEGLLKVFNSLACLSRSCSL